ncbi:MAG: crossover junction endodeoxyribonuclease RuvC [Bacteroidetes bacterium]|nr:crossover junction endodeoxyribonuclease RuvC [Bacteroidota bacterium]MBK7108711.1 crossover junction endodeoxyribonuclease RuvC [Bacteroidota bacterium]MBK8488963.1 crossover junction endodeoxyribonuclease RuvC [Bacteroidota bacterium]MBK8680811.1 crossover junction endodeoxyribonuclease RuvC [Bacteroidota bacterium]
MTTINTKQVIMGVDPGTNLLGYSVIHSDKNTMNILINGVLDLKKTEDHFQKLRLIYDRLHSIIEAYNPTVLAIESPFFGKNVQSMLKLGRAQGAAILVAAHFDMEIIEYSPRRIKQAITGKGNASKEQVALMLKSIFALESIPKYMDESDALAAAACHHYSNRVIQTTKITKHKKGNSWTEFIKSNPDKIQG